MKKTLLLTTALIGTLSVLGSAQAETKISGELKTTYKSQEAFALLQAQSGFTSERQINFATKGTLNNGLAYEAGFSLEQDGSEGSFDGKEGNYFNITSGNTTLEFGMDHILNGDYAIVPRAGAPVNEEIGVIGGLTSAQLNSPVGLQYSQSLGEINGDAGIGIVQKIPSVGTLSFNYVPETGDTMNTGDTDIPGQRAVSTLGQGKDAYEIFFAGDFGVPGLLVALNHSEISKNANATQDFGVTSYGVRYTMGNFSLGGEIAKFEQYDKSETETEELGLTYKISDKASVGIGRTVTEGTKTNGTGYASDEEIDYLQVGYNLGGFTTQFSVINADNIGYTAAQDATTYVVKLGAKF